MDPGSTLLTRKQLQSTHDSSDALQMKQFRRLEQWRSSKGTFCATSTPLIKKSSDASDLLGIRYAELHLIIKNQKTSCIGTSQRASYFYVPGDERPVEVETNALPFTSDKRNHKSLPEVNVIMIESTSRTSSVTWL
jgi:hypothetical protein